MSSTCIEIIFVSKKNILALLALVVSLLKGEHCKFWLPVVSLFLVKLVENAAAFYSSAVMRIKIWTGISALNDSGDNTDYPSPDTSSAIYFLRMLSYIFIFRFHLSNLLHTVLL